MKAGLRQTLGAMPARQLHLLAGGLLLVVAAGLWMYGLRAPLAQLRTVRAEQQRLQAGSADPGRLAVQLNQLETDIASLSARLGLGATHPAPAVMLVTLVGDVNRLALAHGITVNAVTPAPEVQTMVFEQVGFELDATGSYAALLDWMAAMEAAQSTIAIVAFDMAPSSVRGQIHLKIRIAAYRPQEGSA